MTGKLLVVHDDCLGHLKCMHTDRRPQVVMSGVVIVDAPLYATWTKGVPILPLSEFPLFCITIASLLCQHSMLGEFPFNSTLLRGGLGGAACI